MSQKTENLPLLIEPDQLETVLDQPNLRVIDLSKPEVYAQLHVPGAMHLDYRHLIAGTKPAAGLLPHLDRLNAVTRMLGICPDSHVVTCDDEGGGRAGRLLWTLHVLGFTRVSMLNGGIHSWVNENHRVTSKAHPTPGNGTFQVDRIEGTALAMRDYVLEQVENGMPQLLDARTTKEFTGEKAFALRGGHIPGAINLDWMDTIDRRHNMRMKPDDELLARLESPGFIRDREVIVYCQTHHRSSHSYVMLRHLGFQQVLGYAGAWAEWGNDPSLPVESGGR